MPAKVTYQAGPFPDRRAEYTAEVARVRFVMASLTRLAFGVVAIFLAVGALISVAPDVVSSSNPLVQFVFNVCAWFQGPFTRSNGVFTFTGNNADKLNALVNWGAASVFYSAVGAVLRAFLRPRGQLGDDLKDEARGSGKRARRRTVLR